MPERWKTVTNYEDYEVSTLGNVRSHKYDVVKPLKPWIDRQGYAKVRLYKNGIGTPKLVHRLVAQAFIKNPKKYPLINHIHEGYFPKINDVKNLEWDNRSHNMKHAFANGLMDKAIQRARERCGIKHPCSKITEKQALKIKYGNLSYKEITKRYGIKKSEIWLIKSGKRWSCLNNRSKSFI